ncbi:hypothetical protein E2C01_074822 [Portunus trituberculatus]|uniref:Uncharacterized protein n=1 Tax=Portunus trituberculatus TaxID=210409 RepID=A0A5B7IH92_PORTR|nr:hypothetical protein [Portunus trituberculatus]
MGCGGTGLVSGSGDVAAGRRQAESDRQVRGAPVSPVWMWQ